MKHTFKLISSFIIVSGFAFLFNATFVKASPPLGISVTTSAATAVNQTAATLHGFVEYINGLTPTIQERGFDYGTDTNYGSSIAADGTPDVGNFSATLSGLSCGTTYHVRAYTTYVNVAYSKPNLFFAFFFKTAFASPPAGQKAVGSDTTFSTLACNGNNQVFQGHGASSCYHFSDNTYGSCVTTFPAPTISPTGLSPASSTEASTTVITETTATSTKELLVRDLYLNTSGDDVLALQNFLIHNQFLTSSSTQSLRETGATSYFGLFTKGSLIEYQELKGISPAIGFFGPVTQHSVLMDLEQSGIK